MPLRALLPATVLLLFVVVSLYRNTAVKRPGDGFVGNPGALDATSSLLKPSLPAVGAPPVDKQGGKGSDVTNPEGSNALANLSAGPPELETQA